MGPVLSSAVADAESRGLPVSLIGWDGLVRGLFVFDEAWRPGAFDVIHWLTQAGAGRRRAHGRSRRARRGHRPASSA